MVAVTGQTAFILPSGTFPNRGPSNYDGLMAVDSTKDRPTDLNPYPWYRARFWDGMRTGTWWQLLWRHRFAVSLSRVDLPLLTSLLTPIHSVCHRWQELRWRRRIEAAPPLQPPLFVIGHWRSGTTLLHELMVLDERHTYPNTYDCFSPADFLSTRGFVEFCFPFLMPDRRPMDNVATGWDRPQEDEFALMNLGVPSIYETAAFPNQGPANVEYLDFAGLAPAKIDQWKSALQWFLKRVHCRDPRRIVLKSPPHLGRVETLLDMFPKAQFIHIVRDPFEIYASTIRLWRALFETQGMQKYSGDWLEEFVFANLDRLYAAFRKQRALLRPDQLCEIRYEDLIANPVGQVRKIYETLQLGGLENVLPRLESYVASLADYKTNQHRLEAATRDRIAARWEWQFREYGYAIPPSAPAETPSEPLRTAT